MKAIKRDVYLNRLISRKEIKWYWKLKEDYWYWYDKSTKTENRST